MHPHLLRPHLPLPGSADLPCSDDTPVDNEHQNTLPNWLLAILEEIWQDRQDWFFGIDMAIYNRKGQAAQTPTVVPDGFLSLGVKRHQRGDLGRLSYVLQEENGIIPSFVLEMVSKTYGGEYDDKLHNYAKLGIPYYVIYNREYSHRRHHQPLEIYKLIHRHYELQQGEPYWMPEIALGIGRTQGKVGGIEREWLAWFDPEGNPYPLPSQLIEQERQKSAQLERTVRQERRRAEQERQRADQERQRAEQLAARLRALGIDPDQD